MGHRQRHRKSTRRPLLESLESRRLLALSPTGSEQEFMQLVNRFRHDPQGEYARLSPQFDGVLKEDMNNSLWQVNRTKLRSELQQLNSAPPLVWNEVLVDVAELNNAEMQRQKEQGHYHGSSAIRAALTQAGVPPQDIGRTAQNVYGYGKSLFHVYASYVVEWGPGQDGMLNGRPHRTNIMRPEMNFSGQDIATKSGRFRQDTNDSRPVINTHNLAAVRNTGVYVTGAIFQDKNGSGWYESGEGLSKVKFTFERQDGEVFTTTGFGSGGYQIQLPAGTYSATATGGGMKYAQRKNAVVVGQDNVWANWIYDPGVIPPDSFEANDTLAKASQLSPQDQSLSGLSIHTTRDVDLFRFSSPASGPASLQIQFANSQGNLDLQLLDGSGRVLETSAGNTNQETITVHLNFDSDYFVKILGRSGARNDSYSLNLDLPEPSPPVARPESATFMGGQSSIVIDVLANDFDPEDPQANLSVELDSSAPDGFQLNADSKIVFRPPTGYSGMSRAVYTVSNERGLSSSPTQVSVFVLDFERANPWHNTASALDINDDGEITPLDVLLVVNAFHHVGKSGRLPTSGNDAGAARLFGFVDPTDDGYVSALDALLIVNELNAAGEGEAGSRATPPMDHSRQEKERWRDTVWDDAIDEMNLERLGL